jgi:hypothetical protein
LCRSRAVRSTDVGKKLTRPPNSIRRSALTCQYERKLRVSKYARPVGDSSRARSSGSGSVAMM